MIFPFDQLRNHGFEETQSKIDLHTGMLYQMKAEGDFQQIESPFQILRNKTVFETIGPIDTELKKMHEDEVHVFSVSVLLLGNSAMTSPEIKFTERWEEHVEIDGNTHSIHISNLSWCHDERGNAQTR